MGPLILNVIVLHSFLRVYNFNLCCRHVQREHRHIAGRIPTKFGSTRVLPDPLVAAAAVAQAQQQQRLAAAASSSGLWEEVFHRWREIL